MNSSSQVLIDLKDFVRLTELANRYGWTPGGRDGSLSDALNYIEAAMPWSRAETATGVSGTLPIVDVDETLPALDTTHINFSFSEHKHVHFTIPPNLSGDNRELVRSLVRLIASHLPENNA